MTGCMVGMALLSPRHGLVPSTHFQLGASCQGWQGGNKLQASFGRGLSQCRASVRPLLVQAKSRKDAAPACEQSKAGSHAVSRSGYETKQRTDQGLQVVGWQWALTQLRGKVASAAAALVIAAACLAPVADAADVLQTCTCLVKECRAEFVRCLGDPSCAANIACLQTCNGRPDETDCQIGCGDLFENKVVDEFNACAISKKNCVLQKADENLYPIPPATALVPDFKTELFAGTWFISSGLNPTFDTFDCQEHVFTATTNTITGNLTWRISTPDGGFFTRTAVQNFVQDPEQPAVLYNHDNEFLHYQDDWYILASQIEDKPDDFILVYYRGRNDAWDGYGGAVVYTRSRSLPESVVPQLREATAKIGIDFDEKFRTTDNTCSPQLPLFARLGKRAGKVLEDTERALLAEVQDIGKKVEYVGRTEVKLLQQLGKGLGEVEKDEARFLQGLSADELEFFESINMSASELELTFDELAVRRLR